MRVACYQSGIEGVPRDDRWQRVLAECSTRGVDLLVTPEFAIGGLPHTADAALERSLPSAQRVLPWVEDSPPGLTVVLGFTERSGAGLHSSAAVLRDGVVLAVARKLHPREPGLVPGFTEVAGSAAPVFEVAGTTCGVLICADAGRRQPAMDLATAGARMLLCLLNNDMSLRHAQQWDARTRQALADRARETGCWVASADVAGEIPGRRALAATRIHAPDGSLRGSTAEGPYALIGCDIH